MANKLAATALMMMLLGAGGALAQNEAALARPAQPEEAASSAPAPDVARLTDVTVRHGQEGISVEITCTRPITPTPTMISDPSRLVLDFADTVSAEPRNHINVNEDGLKSVRIGVQPVEPPTTRVVLDLEQARDYRLVADGNKLMVNLGEAEAAAPQSAAESSSDPAAPQSAAASSSDPAAPQAAAAPSAALASSSGPSADPVAEANTMIPPKSSAPAASSADGHGAVPQPLHAAKPVAVSPMPAVADLALRSSFPKQPLLLASAKITPLAPAQPVTSKPAVINAPSDYVIGEQDVLSIVVWKERELSATVVVRPDGKITLPLINEIKVVGLTPAQLQTLLSEKFKPFLNIPQVTVEVVQINSRKAYLIGEVQKTGTFPLNSSTTVLQIIAEAGGLRDFAKRKDIYILRNQQGRQVRYRFNYDEVIRGKNPQQNIILQPGDMVVVP